MYGRPCTFEGIPQTAEFQHKYGCAFHGAGDLLAVAISDAPFLWLFQRDAHILTKLPEIATPPVSAAVATSAGHQRCSWGGDYFAIAQESTPCIVVYQRSANTLIKKPDLPGLPDGGAYGCSFSADGIYLSSWTVEGLVLHKRSGDNFTKLSISINDVSSVGALSPDGRYLAVYQYRGDYDRFIGVYKRGESDVFAPLVELPITGNVLYSTASVAFSPDGSLLAGAGNLYRQDGDVFVKIAEYAVNSSCNIALGYGGGALVTSSGVQAGEVRARAYRINGNVVTDDMVSGIPITYGQSKPRSYTFSPDDTLLINGDWNGLYGWIADTDAVPSKPIQISPPNQSYMRVDTDNEFAWTHVNEFGTPQTKADLQLREGNGAWRDLATAIGISQKIIIPKDTLIPGTSQWRVRTYNMDDIPGEWSDAFAFVGVGAPPIPAITSITDAARPVAMWASSGQVGYQLQIGQNGRSVWESGTLSGEIRAAKIPVYLQNGTYLVQVRITNASLLWSAWAEREFTIDVTGPAKPTLTAEAITGAAVLTLTAPDAAKLYLLRDGIPIANVTGLTTYTDYAALGSAVYVLRAVDASDNYTDSDPVGVTVVVPLGMVATLAAVDDLSNPAPLRLTRGGPRMITGSKSRGATYHHYAGREYPVARYSGHSTAAYELSVAYLASPDRDRLLILLDRRRTMLYRDKWGNRWYVTVPDNGYEQDRIATSLTLTMHLTDYVEQIDYEV